MTTAQIAKVREASDLVAIASEYANLTKRGAEWWCCCLFHSEKSGSLHFHPEMQVYNCFGCGASGDVFQFVMAMENVAFPQAVKILAESAGIDLDKEERLTMDQKVELARRRQQAEMEAGDCAATIGEFLDVMYREASDIRRMCWSFDRWALQQDELPERGWEWLDLLVPLGLYGEELVRRCHVLQDAEPMLLMTVYRLHRAKFPVTAAVVRRRMEDREHAHAVTAAIVDMLAQSQGRAA